MAKIIPAPGEDKPLTIKLRKPITLGETVIEELVFREPKAKDLRGLSLTIGEGGMKLEFDSILKLAARCCGQTDAVIDRLGFQDMAEAGEAIMDFIGLSQPTGPTPSES